MTYDEIANSKQFKELLEQIPESERSKVEEAIRAMVKDFEKTILTPLQSITKR